MKTTTKLFLTILTAVQLTSSIAAEITSVATGNWNATSTWDCACVPTSTDNVTIAAGQTVTSTGSDVIYDLTLNATGILYVATGTSITVNNNLVNSGTIDNDGTLTLSKGCGENTGTLQGDGTHILSGRNWNLTGTFTAENSTLKFTGTSAQTISGATTFNNLVIDNSAGVSISTNSHSIKGTLTLTNGTFTTNNSVTLVSDANGTARIGEITGGAISGDVTVQRYIDAGATGWHFMGSPVTGRTIADWNDDYVTTGFTGSNYPNYWFNSIYTYNEPTTGTNDNGFVGATNTTNSLAVGQGFWSYIGPAPLTIDVTGPAVTGNQSLPLSCTDDPLVGVSDDGWNMVSNPYASTIDWDDAGWTKTNVDNALYIWDPDAEVYASYVDGVGTNNGGRYIASSQGFWVHTNGASPVLNITESAKVDIDPTFFRTSNNQQSIIRLAVNGQSLNDETVVRFKQGAQNIYDGNEDAYKVTYAWSQAPSISSLLDSNEFSINSMPVPTTDLHLKIKVNVQASGNYTIKVKELINIPTGFCLLLEDLYTNAIINLDYDSTYTCFISDTTKAARFLLHFQAPVQTQVQHVTCNGAANGTAMAQGQGDGPWTYQWEDMNGNVLRHVTNVSGADEINGLHAGSYIVIAADNGVCSESIDTIYIAQPNELLVTTSATDDNVNTCTGTAAAEPTGGSMPYTYLWNDEESQTTQMATNLCAGEYHVTVQDNNGCSTTAQVVVQRNVGVNDNISDNNTMTVYPNPTNGELNIVGPQMTDAPALLQIFNAMGQLVLEEQSNTSRFNMNLQAKPGVYHVRITIDHNTYDQKIILK